MHLWLFSFLWSEFAYIMDAKFPKHQFWNKNKNRREIGQQFKEVSTTLIKASRFRAFSFKIISIWESQFGTENKKKLREKINCCVHSLFYSLKKKIKVGYLRYFEHLLILSQENYHIRFAFPLKYFFLIFVCCDKIDSILSIKFVKDQITIAYLISFEEHEREFMKIQS